MNPSPDGSDILFIFSLKIKRYSEQQEIAPENIKTKHLDEKCKKIKI